MKHILYDFAGYNVLVFNKLNHLLGQDESYLLTLADQLGFYRSFPIFLSLVLIYCYFSIASAKDNKKQYEKVVIGWTNTLITFFTSLLVMLCFIGILKIFFAFKRPFCHEDIDKIKVFHTALIGVECHRSFPSGHTAYICTILFSIWPVLNHLAKGIGVFIALSVALSRIASGVHFPADILWAGLISLLIVLAIHRITKTIINKKYSKQVLKFAKSII